MWRLLWVLVVVGVVGGVAEEEEGGRGLTLEEIYKLKFGDPTKEAEETLREKREACEGVEDFERCMNGFLFTATALKEVRSGGELVVVLSLEESLYPHVTFDLSLRSLGDTDFDLSSRRAAEEEWGEERVLAREEVTLEVNELRRVVLRVGDLPWKTAYLVVTAHPTGHSEIKRHTYAKIQKVSSDVDVFVQTEKSEYAPGDTVDYRALVVDGNVDKTPKFAQVIVTRFAASLNETRLPWVEVPENGAVRGNFTFDGRTRTDVRVRVTSDVTSSDSSMATSPELRTFQRFERRGSLSIEVSEDIYFSQPRVKGRVKLTLPEGIPLEGHCNVTIQRGRGAQTEVAERNVPVGVAGGGFEFDVMKKLSSVREEAGEHAQIFLKATCRQLHAEGVEEAMRVINFQRSLFRVDLLSVESLPRGNSSHPQATVVLQFLVERRDGGSVEEEEPSKGLHVELLLANGSSGKLLFSPHKFSLPIPQDGRVRLEIPVSDLPPAPWNDRIRIQVGDAEELSSLSGSPVQLTPDIHLTPIDPAQLIRRGDVVRFRVRSCVHYASVNVILSSSKAIYFSEKFSFSPQEDGMNEVIELTIPQEVTEGSLTLMVYGRSRNPYHRSTRRDGQTASVQLIVVSSHEQQFIRIVDQRDLDMSTIVTFRLEGLLPDSVVSLQAVKSDSLEGKAEGREEIERPLKCHVRNRENPENKVRDESPGAVDPTDLDISANFDIWRPSPFLPRSLVFIDVDRKTTTMDNGTLTVTKTFDRSTEFGSYVVSGATFDLKSGRRVFQIRLF